MVKLNDLIELNVIYELTWNDMYELIYVGELKAMKLDDKFLKKFQ